MFLMAPSVLFWTIRSKIKQKTQVLIAASAISTTVFT